MPKGAISGRKEIISTNSKVVGALYNSNLVPFGTTKNSRIYSQKLL